jgi:hypothetical protein
VHNHRRFVRGKRAGKAPIELLTGKELEQTWLELLLEQRSVTKLRAIKIPTFQVCEEQCTIFL